LQPELFEQPAMPFEFFSDLLGALCYGKVFVYAGALVPNHGLLVLAALLPWRAGCARC
jgi:hypothetical protein